MSFCHEQGLRHSEFLSWEEDDRAKALAYFMEKAEFCSMCGTAGWQWEDDRYAFEPVIEVCHGCEKKDVMRDDDAKLPAGASIVLIPKDEAKRRREEQQERERLRKERQRAWSPSTSS